MSSTLRKRISFISNARIIGILLVVFGHSYPFNVHIPGALSQLKSFIYAFHMPLFILISGYLSAQGQHEPKEYIAVRAKKLLVPYFVLSLVAFLPKMLVQQYLNDAVEFSFIYLLRSELVPRENVWGHFWYIPVIFSFGIFSALFGKYIKEYKWVRFIALIISYSLLWMHESTAWFALEDIRNNLFYYVLGMVLANSSDSEKIVKNKLWLLGLPIAVVAFSQLKYHRALVPILVIGFILYIGTIVDLHKIPAFTWIERYSYTIFLLSWPIQAVVEVLFNKVLHLPVLVSMLGMCMAGIIVPLVCVKVIERLEKYIPVRWLKIAIGL